MEAFKTMISPSLKKEIIRHIFSKVITQNPIFQNASEKLINFVLKSVNTTSNPPEDSVIKQGEDPDFLYLISKGEV